MYPLLNMVCCLILSIFLVDTVHAESLETVTLRHRLADQVLPVLQGAFPQARIQAFYGTLIIAAPDEPSLAQIKRLLLQLDTPLQNLIVTVEQRSISRDAQEKLSAQGRVVLNNGDIDVTARVAGQNQQSNLNSTSLQTLRILDGAEGFIQLGQQRFVPQISFVFRPQYSIIHSAGTWQSAGTGFFVVPRRIGDTQIALKLMPSQRRFIQGGGPQGQDVFSEVQGQLGEWLPVGETRQMQSVNDQGLLSTNQGSSEMRYSVWVKVELPK